MAVNLATVTCDQMHHTLFCMGHLGIAPTMHIQRGPHDHPPGNFGLEHFYFVSVLNLSNSSCCALYAPSRLSPAFVPRQQATLVLLANKHTRNVCSLSAPSSHEARGVLAQDALARTPLWLPMMKPYPSANGHRDLKQADRKDSGQLALSPQALICPPPS
ncbi:hypothetical protein O181_119154 [Austropuccinia psidii MF-1]|uniref:Uncharacterized protein n=1 Tax=Austropuccinia psidii MF-1 TaxID=1389203 RepID=A0A9Q3PZ66_9BASI|nr:hypothetical protein [Austropuccinia psidii MF-1]